jgi:hypothetical protein
MGADALLNHVNSRSSKKKLIIFSTLCLVIYLAVISYIMALAAFNNPIEATSDYQPELDGDIEANGDSRTPWLTMFAVSIIGIGLALYVLIQRGYLQLSF